MISQFFLFTNYVYCSNILVNLHKQALIILKSNDRTVDNKAYCLSWLLMAYAYQGDKKKYLFYLNHLKFNMSLISPDQISQKACLRCRIIESAMLIKDKLTIQEHTAILEKELSGGFDLNDDYYLLTLCCLAKLEIEYNKKSLRLALSIIKTRICESKRLTDDLPETFIRLIIWSLILLLPAAAKDFATDYYQEIKELIVQISICENIIQAVNKYLISDPDYPSMAYVIIHQASLLRQDILLSQIAELAVKKSAGRLTLAKNSSFISQAEYLIAALSSRETEKIKKKTHCVHSLQLHAYIPKLRSRI